MNSNNTRLLNYSFSSIYELYIKKVERKNRTQAELDDVICWLTGYTRKGLQEQINSGNTLETFFAEAPQINPNASLITGVICGIRVEEMTDKLMQKIRYMDKLVDELAKSRSMEKILRK